jgi:hypothetical protein
MPGHDRIHLPLALKAPPYRGAQQWLESGPGVGRDFCSWVALRFGVRAKMTTEVSKLTLNSIQIGLTLLTLFALSALFSAIQQGLLGIPEMQIARNHSNTYELNWYQDRIGTTLPQA